MNMDINDLRSLFTVITFALFMAIVAWTFSARRKQAFDEAALLPFADDESLEVTGKAGQARVASIGQDERKAS